MATVTLEQITQLAVQLPALDQRKLIAYLEDRLTAPVADKKPQSLYGIWKGHFPEDLDVEAAIREIRDEWKKELDEDFS